MRRRPSGSSAEDDERDIDPTFADATLGTFSEGAGGRRGAETNDFRGAHEILNITTNAHTTSVLDRRKSIDKRPAPADSESLHSQSWVTSTSRNALLGKDQTVKPAITSAPAGGATTDDKMVDSRLFGRRSSARDPWSLSLLTLVTTAIAVLSIFTISHSFLTRQLDPKGCRMSMMRPSFAKLEDFDTEHTRFASKYSVYLYREQLVDEDTMVPDSAPQLSHSHTDMPIIGQRGSRALHTRKRREL
jgi:glycosylphosphatidylinositol deacylase